MRTATVTFSAKYYAPADGSKDFLYWQQSSNSLQARTNSSSTLDGVVIKNMSIDLDDDSATGTATFSVYSYTTAADEEAMFYKEYYICSGTIVLEP